jgi:peptidyl-tRNA hydrolase
MRPPQERVEWAALARAQTLAQAESGQGRISSRAETQFLTTSPSIAVPIQQTSTQQLSQAGNPSASAAPTFGGTYEALNPQQKKLMDEWYVDYNKLTGDHASPTEYNQYSLSTRTTYEAVTHALMTTQLTEQSGKPMGPALDLVEAIEAISGKVSRARGDLQFRMYVVLKPGAIEKLKASQEFFRDRENTVYHKGYPLNYRQAGTPSIQFSISKDGRHADIDVDYRSSGIPQGLFNGHLTAANSDVRAGNNTQVHLQRWQGLTDWWRGLFGLPSVTDDPNEGLLPGDVPPVPRKGDGKLQDAVQDFLQAWLVEGKPEVAASYFSTRSFPCLAEYGSSSGRVVNAGNAPYVAAKHLGSISKSIGKVTVTSLAVQPENLTGRDIKPMKHAHMSTFALYQLTNQVGLDYECDPDAAYEEQEKTRAARSEDKPGTFYASVFGLRSDKSKSDVIALIWTKESRYWKVVAWEVEGEGSGPGIGRDTRPANAARQTAKQKISADPAVVQASLDFLHTWLVNDDYDKASSYLSQRCDACVDMFLPEGEKPPSGPEKYPAYIRETLNKVAQKVGKVEHLNEVLEPVKPAHADLRTVEHTGEGAYTLVAVPDDLASSFECEKRSKKHPYSGDEAAQKVYGNYYATMFAFRTPGEHAAALTLLWGKDGGQWKILSYELVTP